MRKIIFAILLITLKQIVFAQEKSACYAGVYITKEDFINNRLSYKINTDSPGNKLGFPAPADWALTLKMVTPGHSYTFKPGTIFGYFHCGKVYRYSAGEELYASEDYFQIEEDGNLVVYTSVFNGGTEYYYSVNLTSTIHRLNMKNLEQDFKDYPKFIEAVKSMKNKGVEGDLAKRGDDGKFIINKLYDETIKK